MSNLTNENKSTIKEETIISAVIVNEKYSNSIIVDTQSSKGVLAIQYYPDEISFTIEEVIGLTLKEVYELHFKKDLAYLRS